MSFLTRLFGTTATSTEILCPHCERSMDAGHDVEACARKRMSRRYFFGVLGGAAAVLAMPAGLVKAPTDYSLSIRMIRNYDPLVDAMITRLDVLYGFARIAPGRVQLGSACSTGF